MSTDTNKAANKAMMDRFKRRSRPKVSRDTSLAQPSESTQPTQTIQPQPPRSLPTATATVLEPHRDPPKEGLRDRPPPSLPRQLQYRVPPQAQPQSKPNWLHCRRYHSGVTSG